MPETFGTGTAGPAYDPRCQPVLLTRGFLGPAQGTTFPNPTSSGVFVLTALDVVSNGGGSGGPIFFYTGNVSFNFVVFNAGSSSDAFSWRGFLVLDNSLSGVQNSSDTSISYHASGLAFMPSF